MSVVNSLKDVLNGLSNAGGLFSKGFISIMKIHHNFVPANKATEVYVQSLVDSFINSSYKIPEEITKSVICGCLAFRGFDFALGVMDLSKTYDGKELEHYKKAYREVSKCLVGYLLQKVHRNTYRIHPNAPHTVVRDLGNPDLPFKCTNPYVYFQRSSSITNPKLVTQMNSRHAVPVILPQVGTTFDYLQKGTNLPINFERLEEHPQGLYQRERVQLYRNEIDLWLKKFRYMAVLVQGDDPEAISFTCVEDHAHELADFIQVRTIKWLGSQGMPLTKMYSEVHTRDGRVVAIPGHATSQAKQRGLAHALP